MAYCVNLQRQISSPNSGSSAANDRIAIVRGNDVFSLIENARFLADWEQLFIDCPWATAFQAPGFVCAWYRVYRPRFEPVIVLSVEEDKLQGLFTLALDEGLNRLLATGGDDAEYQCWLSRPESGNSFSELAFAAIRASFPLRKLVLKYTTPGAPVDSVASTSSGPYITIQRVDRPLWDFSANAPAGMLRRRKRKLSRLARTGDFEYSAIEDPDQMEAVFRAIVPDMDFRKAALGGTLPYSSDPLKIPFYAAVARESHLLHMCTLRLNGDIIAAQVAISSKGSVHLWLLAHSPLYSQYSPGTVSLMLLADGLVKKGFACLDLTPWGMYKERAATGHDRVCILTLHHSRIAALLKRIRNQVRQRTRDLLEACGDNTLKIAHLARSVGASAVLLTFAWEEFRICALESGCDDRTGEPSAPGNDLDSMPANCGGFEQRQPSLQLAMNRVADLVSGLEPEARSVRHARASQWMARLGAGEQCYTFVSDGELQFLAWTAVCDTMMPLGARLGRLRAQERCLIISVECAGRNARECFAQLLRQALPLADVGKVFVCERAGGPAIGAGPHLCTYRRRTAFGICLESVTGRGFVLAPKRRAEAK